jgi:hypothetical protein
LHAAVAQVLLRPATGGTPCEAGPTGHAKNTIEEDAVHTKTCAMAGILSLWLSSAAAQAPAHPKYDYPTAARADFVIGCLLEHDFKHEFLDACACRIDVIADQLSYEDFDAANTILGVQRNGGMGRANVLFRDTPVAKAEMAKFHTAQAAADRVCK